MVGSVLVAQIIMSEIRDLMSVNLQQVMVCFPIFSLS